MIEFQNVTKKYGNNVAIENLDLKIEKGEFVFLVGPSGAGKSTCIKLLLKEIEADEGIIFVGEREVTSLPARLVPAH
ncbi:MAG: ATP-binding cassette domain-containing protein, partial [Firmicutes bacterium]|nr:ATP-binding cassette domain-containing protein [Bacillota bacterium]